MPLVQIAEFEGEHARTVGAATVVLFQQPGLAHRLHQPGHRALRHPEQARDFRDTEVRRDGREAPENVERAAE